MQHSCRGVAFRCQCCRTQAPAAARCALTPPPHRARSPPSSPPLPSPQGHGRARLPGARGLGRLPGADREVGWSSLPARGRRWRRRSRPLRCGLCDPGSAAPAPIKPKTPRRAPRAAPHSSQPRRVLLPDLSTPPALFSARPSLHSFCFHQPAACQCLPQAPPCTHWPATCVIRRPRLAAGCRVRVTERRMWQACSGVECCKGGMYVYRASSAARRVPAPPPQHHMTTSNQIRAGRRPARGRAAAWAHPVRSKPAPTRGRRAAHGGRAGGQVGVARARSAPPAVASSQAHGNDDVLQQGGKEGRRVVERRAGAGCSPAPTATASPACWAMAAVEGAAAAGCAKPGPTREVGRCHRGPTTRAARYAKPNVPAPPLQPAAPSRLPPLRCCWRRTAHTPLQPAGRWRP